MFVHRRKEQLPWRKVNARLEPDANSGKTGGWGEMKIGDKKPRPGWVSGFFVGDVQAVMVSNRSVAAINQNPLPP